MKNLIFASLVLSQFMACSSLQSEAHKRNTSVIAQAVQVFNKNPDDSRKVFDILKKLKKESSGYYEYSVKGFEDSDTEVVVKVTAAQLKEYFSSYKREMAKINTECSKVTVPEHLLKEKLGQIETCYERKLDHLIHKYESIKVSAGNLIQTISITPVGVTSSDCEGVSVRSHDIVAEHLKCSVKNQKAAYAKKVAAAYNQEDVDLRQSLKRSEQMQIESGKDGTAAKVEVCKIDMRVEAVDEAIAREKEVSKQTGYVSVGKIQLLTSEKLRLQKMSADFRKAIENEGGKVSNKSCKELYGY